MLGFVFAGEQCVCISYTYCRLVSMDKDLGVGGSSALEMGAATLGKRPVEDAPA